MKLATKMGERLNHDDLRIYERAEEQMATEYYTVTNAVTEAMA